MVQAKPVNQHASGVAYAAVPAPAEGFVPGGEVGLLHSELARHFGAVDATPSFAPLSPDERTIRLLSVGAGYAALACGVIAVAVTIF